MTVRVGIARRWLMLPLAVALVGAAPIARDNWAAGWLSATVAPDAATPTQAPVAFANETTRQVLRIDATGSALRLRLTNELGTAPLRAAAVHIALLDEHGMVVAGSDRAVTFAGVAEAWLPTGSPLLSDPVALPVTALQHVAVSVFYREAMTPAAHLTELLVAPGDQSAAAALAGARALRGPVLVSEIDVRRARPAPVIVAFGDSITEGAASTPGKDLSWPQQLAARLAGDPARRGWSVVNAGISGNRLLREGVGVPALGRFDRDALAVAGVTHIVVLEGINDIGGWNSPGSETSAARIIAAYRQLVERAHARGVKVVGATILPFKGASYYTPEGEAMRTTVNRFIRTGGLFDGVIDFDKAAADPGDPTRIAPQFDPGDHLHPNDAGYAALAAAVSPALFEAR